MLFLCSSFSVALQTKSDRTTEETINSSLSSESSDSLEIDYNKEIHSDETIISGNVRLPNGDFAELAEVLVYSISSDKTYETIVSSWGFFQIRVDFEFGTQYVLLITYEEKWCSLKKSILNESLNFFEMITLTLGVKSLALYQIKEYIPSDIITFHGFSCGGDPPYSYNWDFGDNSQITLQNPIHSYDKHGSYSVVLTVSDSSNNVDTDYIQITIDSFVISLEFDDKIYEIGEAIYFHGFIRGGTPPFQWFWNFGDGENSNLQSPTHKYSKADIFTVNLSVMDSTGNLKSIESSIIISSYIVSLRGITHSVDYHGGSGSFKESFPLGRHVFFLYWPDVFYNPVIAPLYYANARDDNPEVKLVTYKAYNHLGNEIFSHTFYNEFSIIMSPFCTVYGPEKFPYTGKAIVYGS